MKTLTELCKIDDRLSLTSRLREYVSGCEVRTADFLILDDDIFYEDVSTIIDTMMTAALPEPLTGVNTNTAVYTEDHRMFWIYGLFQGTLTAIYGKYEPGDEVQRRVQLVWCPSDDLFGYTEIIDLIGTRVADKVVFACNQFDELTQQYTYDFHIPINEVYLTDRFLGGFTDTDARVMAAALAVGAHLDVNNLTVKPNTASFVYQYDSKDKAFIDFKIVPSDFPLGQFIKVKISIAKV